MKTFSSASSSLAPRVSAESSENSIGALLGKVTKLFSFQYNDKPLDDQFYELHMFWLKLFHDIYFRVEHLGHVQEGLEVARHEHVIFISNHVIALEAALIGYYLYRNQAGKLGTLVYPEAFKLPLVREFFRSGQCVAATVENGVQTLFKKHLLLFPEGMDFVSHIINPDRVPKFHKGFLRMAKGYMEKSHRKHIKIIPIGHAGIEQVLKLWVVKNETFLDLFIKPFANYPFWIFPKLPFLMPSKVVMDWGSPVTLTLEDLKNEKKLIQKSNAFRSSLLALKARAAKLRGMETQS
ncbi:MAG: 1-acyl-sn-glycerol-3-phosphate acyltransferase [Deltaproteobacteria bacterium]|nr:1-acyl-sn-glycerol-3-phosphate acyltransferase [Deltaproteobacteria bacterium]